MESKSHYAEGCDIMGDSTEGFAEAKAAAEQSDLAIVVVGGRSGLSGLIVLLEIFPTWISPPLKGTVKDTDGESHDRGYP